jgi:IPT/TIG domain/WD40-like Beta Propeller Repeat
MRLRWAAPTALTLLSFLLAGCGGSTAPNATPQITGLFPSEITAGSQAFTLFVGGTQFISTTTVQWNGSNRPTTFNSASGQLAASITAADVQNAGIASVTVTSPAPGGGVSLAVSFTINPVHSGGPTITSLSPTSAALNGAAFTLMVTGTNFAPTDYVTWSGGLRTTTFASSTQISAAIPATDLTQQMIAGVAVHASQLGVASPSVSFQVGSSPSSSVMPEVISVNAIGGPADGPSSSPAVSADGRFVAFRSEAKNLVASGASGNIFVRDTCLGAASGCMPGTIAVDLAPDGSPPNGVASAVAISADGRYVAFSSHATNLAPDVLAGQAQFPRAFMRDLCRGNSAPVNCLPRTELVSIEARESVTGRLTMSADGRFVAFTEKSKFVTVHDTCRGATAACTPRGTLASVDDVGLIPALTGDAPSISQNGRYVAFAGWGPPAQKPQIFLRDTCAAVSSTEACTPSTIRVSVGPDGAVGDAASSSPSVSADGRFVVFESAASNLTFDHSTHEDVYSRDMCLGPTAPLGCVPSTIRISTEAGLGGQSLGNYSPAISPSGRYISYTAQISRDTESNSSGLGKLIVFDTCFGTVGPCSSEPIQVLASDGSPVSLAFDGANQEPVRLTPDGRFVVFFNRDVVPGASVGGWSDVYLTKILFQSRH